MTTSRVEGARAQRPNWRDSRWLNWRICNRLCIRIVPGLWLPGIIGGIIWNRPSKHFAIMLPFVAIGFDYDPLDGSHAG